jgi:hypothetical protein
MQSTIYTNTCILLWRHLHSLESNLSRPPLQFLWWTVVMAFSSILILRLRFLSISYWLTNWYHDRMPSCLWLLSIRILRAITPWHVLNNAPYNVCVSFLICDAHGTSSKKSAKQSVPFCRYTFWDSDQKDIPVPLCP